MKNKITREKELETILTICVVLVVFYFVTKKQHAYWLTLSVLLGLTGLFSKTIASKIVWAWMKLSEILGSVSSKVILTLVFFCFLWPVAVLSRIFGNKSNLQLSKTDNPSYFIERNHKYTAEDLENGW